MNGKLWWTVLATVVVLQSGALGWIVSRQYLGLERVVVIEKELELMDSGLGKEVSALSIRLDGVNEDMKELKSDVRWIYQSTFADTHDK